MTKFGMSPRAGYISYKSSEKGLRLCDITSLPDEARIAVRNIMATAFDNAKTTLAEHGDMHAAMAEQLMEAKTISGERMAEMWNSAAGTRSQRIR